jgi:hypothetical protein
MQEPWKGHLTREGTTVKADASCHLRYGAGFNSTQAMAQSSLAFPSHSNA